jgi:hypothetical protein
MEAVEAGAAPGAAVAAAAVEPFARFQQRLAEIKSKREEAHKLLLEARKERRKEPFPSFPSPVSLIELFLLCSFVSLCLLSDLPCSSWSNVYVFIPYGFTVGMGQAMHIAHSVLVGVEGKEGFDKESQQNQHPGNHYNCKTEGRPWR